MTMTTQGITGHLGYPSSINNNRSSGRHNDMDEDDWDNNSYGGVGSMHDPNDYYEPR